MLKETRIWILSSWCFLTIGILLGSWWAYHELGWGGWWFWDPVENASLMPWLLATASIHSITHPKLNNWTLICTQTTFLFSILGTFFVRSGLLNSVHSFATDSTRGFFLLFFLISILYIFVNYWVSRIVQKNRSDFASSRPSLAPNGFSTQPDGSSAFVSIDVPKKHNGAKRLRELSKKRRATPERAKKIEKTPGPSTRIELHGPERNVRNFLQSVGPKEPLGAQDRRSRQADRGTAVLTGLLLLQNFYFCVICFIVFCGTSAPLVFHLLWNREIGTGVSFYNGTIIPLFTSVFLILLYTHYLQTRRAKREKTWSQSQARSELSRTQKPTEILSGDLPKGPVRATRSEETTLSAIYLAIFFFSQTFCCAFFFNLNLLNSIYAAICFLLVSFIILSITKTPVNFGKRQEQPKLQNPVPWVTYQSTVPFDPNSGVIFVRAEARPFLASPLRSREERSTKQLDPEKALRAQPIEPASFLQGFALFSNLFCQHGPLSDRFAPSEEPKTEGPSWPQTGRLIRNKIIRQSQEMNLGHTGVVLFITGILSFGTFKFEYTEQLHSGPSGVRLGSQICCLRSIDHSFAPTYHSLCANLLVYEQNRFDWIQRPVNPFQCNYNIEGFAPNETQLVTFCMFPEKRFYYSGSNATVTKVAIHSNLFTDFYSLIGTGSVETGWFTTIMKLPFIFCIWLGFLFGIFGGTLSLKKKLKKSKLCWD